MTPELAEHISRLAAPIYAAMLERALMGRSDYDVPLPALAKFRRDAIAQAQALWQKTLDTEA